MKKISLDNGHSFMTVAEAMPEIRNMWDTIVNLMDDDVRETVNAELAPCTKEEFLQQYLELADNDLAIG